MRLLPNNEAIVPLNRKREDIICSRHINFVWVAFILDRSNLSNGNKTILMKCRKHKR